MAGPRAPIGTLSQHAAAAAGLVRGMVPAMFTRTDPKRARKAEVPESESESDSDSSNSDTEETNESTGQNWADKLKASKVASTPTTAVKPIKAESGSGASLKAKVDSSAAKADIKKRPASESSASESESSSDDDDEADKMAVDPKSDSETESKNTKSGSAKVKQDAKEEPDSDSESESSDEEMADAKPSKNSPSTSASEASASEAESSDEDSAPAAKRKVKADPPAKADEESASESESEDEQAPAANAKTAAQSESESESESDSESESEEDPEPPKKSKPAKETANAKKTAPAKASKAPAAVNGDASEAESDSEGEDAAESVAVEKRGGKTGIQAPREIVSQGFHLRKAEEDVDAAAVARAFKKAKAEGKQIWYFTTPKSVPIEVIQKHAIPLDKVHTGKSIFAHEGADYTGHFEETVNHAIKVLIPGKTGSNYETLKQPVDRVLHITRVTRFGDDTETELAAAAVTPTVVAKAPRPQPKGLKARYQAFGVPNGASSVGIDASDNDEDVEMAQAPPLDAKSDTKAAKKRKHGDVEKTSNQDEAASTPIKKAKKARVDSSSTKAVEPSPAKAAKQTPIAPPPIPPATKAVVPSEPAQSAPKKTKGKGKSKKDAASAEKASDSKKPTKVTPGAIQQAIRATSVPPDYQSMSKARKRREAAQTSTPGTPGTPTKQRIASLTPVPIPGIYTPRKVIPSEPWTLKDPVNPARPNGTPTTASSQPLKSILKTPEKYSGGKGAHSGGKHKSSKKKKKQGTPSVSWTGDTKRGHGSS
ncbi:hypothetical protein C8A01DRAFT_41209 [Parachaetomium inaequale]|uniref:Uncharacterized protein n=1 Tax=Parachaetomium inaequale TaxID=2588326 RepID=A0AAN6P664_9PEZI|nr:hypothetical protein C8A01DRAFT_41209 [Parachaetomium inaequale]